METTIILQGKEAKMWAMMQALDSIGAFDVRYGRVTIDFDGEAKISNVKVEHNYRLMNLSTAPTA